MKRWQSSTDPTLWELKSPGRIIGIRIPDFGTNNPHGLVPLTIIHQQAFKVHFMDVTNLKPSSVVAETLKHGSSCVQTSWA